MSQTSMINKNVDISSDVLHRNVNKCISESNSLSRPYPFKFFKGCVPQILLGSFLNTLSHLKSAEVLPIFKKDQKRFENLKDQKRFENLKSNFRPVSILSNVSKIFDMCRYDQLVNYFDHFFFKISVWFLKGF